MKKCQRKILKKIGIFCLIILFIFASGCGGEKTNKSLQGSIKIGLLVPYTGVYASLGSDITRGMELYLDQVDWQVKGREIKLIKEDSEMKGQVGLQKVRRLIESEKIDILTGTVSSSVAYAIRDYVVKNNTPFIIANAGASGLTREKGSKYIFRVSFANGQNEYPMGQYTYNKLNSRKVVVMASDYAAGHEKAQGFMDGFQESGGEVIQEIYPKLGTADYGPYLAQVNKEADAVWVFFSGTDAIRFVNQYSEYGLKDKTPLLSAGDLVDESFLPLQGDNAIGIISGLHYSAALNTPENNEFTNNYRSKYEEGPNMFAEQGYVAAKVIVETLQAMDTFDTEQFLAELRKVQFVAPRGPFQFDPQTQNVIFNTYIRKTEKINNKYVNTITETIPDVTDRWSQVR